MENVNLCWETAEVRALIDVWSDDTVQAQLEGMKRNKSVFVRISRELLARGYSKSFTQCRNKLKALKAEYKKVKDNNNTSGRKRISCKFYNELDAILGARPATRPKHLVDTSLSPGDVSGTESESENTIDTPQIHVACDGNVQVHEDEIGSESDTDGPSPLQSIENTVTEVTPVLQSCGAETPRKPSVQRRPHVSKQRSLGDAVIFMAESQAKSDEMFLKLEERRMILEQEAEARREKSWMDYEMRQLKMRQDFELKRMEMMMQMNNQYGNYGYMDMYKAPSNQPSVPTYTCNSQLPSTSYSSSHGSDIGSAVHMGMGAGNINLTDL